jgi:hypothetical protein
VGIARGRSYASVLVIPRRKTSLCETPNRRQPWPDLKLHVSSPERGRRRGRRGGAGGAWGCYALQGAARGGGHGALQGLVPCCSFVLCVGLVLCVRETAGRGRRRRGGKRRKRKKEGKEKEKNMEIFSNLKMFEK